MSAIVKSSPQRNGPFDNKLKFHNKILWCPKPRRVDNFFEKKHFKKICYTNHYTLRKIKSNKFGNKNTNYEGPIY